MVQFIAKRLVFTVIVCLSIIFFVSLGMRMAANSHSSRPSYDLGTHARQAARTSAAYLGGLLRGDLGRITLPFGRSSRQVAVWDILVDAYPKSMGLLFVALMVSAALGIPLGMAAAVYRRSGWSLALLSLTLVGISVPAFLVAALIQTLEILWYRRTGARLFPVGGFGWDLHLVVPTLVLAARPLAMLARVSFIALSDVLTEGYIDTAKAKGLPPRIILRRHAYPNATVPILAALGVSLRFALGSLPVVEYLLGWPGIGARLLDAIRAGQTQGVVGLALSLGLTIMIINLALDLSYRLVDPRLRDRRV